jgi:hypothetical protein
MVERSKIALAVRVVVGREVVEGLHLFTGSSRRMMERAGYFARK